VWLDDYNIAKLLNAFLVNTYHNLSLLYHKTTHILLKATKLYNTYAVLPTALGIFTKKLCDFMALFAFLLCSSVHRVFQIMQFSIFVDYFLLSVTYIRRRRRRESFFVSFYSSLFDIVSWQSYKFYEKRHFHKNDDRSFSSSGTFG
jgi:hypothetical protein